MKKISILIMFLAGISITSSVYAKEVDTGMRTTINTNTDATQRVVSPLLETKPSPVGIQIQNANQTTTRNAGEDIQLRIVSKEQASMAAISTSSASKRSTSALEHMSDVAKKVQELQQIRTTGGIGEQVRVFAQEQNQAQDKIRVAFEKVENRGRFMKALIGADYQALEDMEEQMQQNEMRLAELIKLQEQISNDADSTLIQEAVQSLVDQNDVLQEKIVEERSSTSLFGWLMKRFAQR